MNMNIQSCHIRNMTRCSYSNIRALLAHQGKAEAETGGPQAAPVGVAASPKDYLTPCSNSRTLSSI